MTHPNKQTIRTTDNSDGDDQIGITIVPTQHICFSSRVNPTKN